MQNSRDKWCKKQYCQIYLSELWNETRLQKAKTVHFKKGNSALSMEINKQLCQLNESELRNEKITERKQSKSEEVKDCKK